MRWCIWYIQHFPYLQLFVEMMIRQTMRWYFIIREEKKKWISVFITMKNVNLYEVLSVRKFDGTYNQHSYWFIHQAVVTFWFEIKFGHQFPYLDLAKSVLTQALILHDLLHIGHIKCEKQKSHVTPPSTRNDSISR